MRIVCPTNKMPHRELYKKSKEDYLSDMDSDDEDIEQLRWEQEQRAQEQRRKKEASRWKHYFHLNGYCRTHDCPACYQCQRWAEGVCPSSWEER